MAPPVTPSKRKRSSPIQDVKFERVEGEGLEDEVLPKTPIKRKREEPAKKLSTPPPSTPKRGSVAPKTPSKSALKKAERERKKAEGERKKQWEKDWEDEVKRSVWPTDRKHIQTLGSNEIHRTEAMKFYRLGKEEMDTLPYTKFENKHNPSNPGRSYPHVAVEGLVSKKFAWLAGLHKQTPQLAAPELLRQGMVLFEQRQQKLLKRSPGRPRQPTLVYLRQPVRRLFPPREPSPHDDRDPWDIHGPGFGGYYHPGTYELDD